MAKDTAFTFGMHAPRDSPDRTMKNFVAKQNMWPHKFDGIKC